MLYLREGVILNPGKTHMVDSIIRFCAGGSGGMRGKYVLSR